MKKFFKYFVLGLLSLIGLLVLYGSIFYSPTYVYRVLVWQDSDAFDWQKFPKHPLSASPISYQFVSSPDLRVEELLTQLSGADNWDNFMETNGTQAFIVIQDGMVLYENYYNDTERDSIVTSFSVAKSFDSALIGKAIDEGYINSVDDPITMYLPELAERDPQFNEITIRHLLLMASGMEYTEMRPLLFNGDDPLTTYFPDQRKLALENTFIIDPPVEYFQYNKYHPQLLGLILERTTGMTVTQYLQTRIWDPIGMEFGGSWSTDSKESDFEKMETGVNARAIDFAKFGVLYLNGGNWNGTQVLPKTWIEESTQPLLPENYDDYYTDYVKAMPGQGYYNYMWWGMVREDGSYDFTAAGDKGQFIYVSPENNMVIVRNGVKYGIDSHEWLKLFYEFVDQY
ncbi:MAG TPA: serine hydrolase [Anaerolineales bacterium]|nr:serine hydrolase [Anaerolineales bacterium]